jgi:hypothetical protein
MSLKDPFPFVNIDLASEIDRYRNENNKKNIQLHLHRPHYYGGSSLGGCTCLRAYENSGIPLPKPTGIKADSGAAQAGTIGHDVEERDGLLCLSKRFGNMYAKYGLKLIFGAEVYVVSEIIPGEFVETPIDICAVTSPGFTKQLVRYQNETREMPVKHSEAQWIRIWDFKNIGGRYFTEMRKKGLSTKYQAQGLFECKVTGLPRCGFVVYNKDNLHHFTVFVEYTDEKWIALQEKFRREMKIGAELKAGKRPLLVKTDFAWYVEEDEFECMYCKRSKTHEIEGDDGENHLVFDEPCAEVKGRIEFEAKQKFVVDSTWKRGKSIIMISEVSDKDIISINKSGTEYVDSLFWAAKHFKPLSNTSEEKESKILIIDADVINLSPNLK